MRTLITLITLILCIMSISADAQPKENLSYEDVYSVYITSNLSASKAFYVDVLNFEIVFESSWFIYLQSPGERKFSFALMDVNHPSSPPAYGAFSGSGSFLTLQVSDAGEVYRKVTEANIPITYHLKKEDWGQIRFGLTDPNGLYIDIVQQVEPKAGYWDQYQPKE